VGVLGSPRRGISVTLSEDRPSTGVSGWRHIADYSPLWVFGYCLACQCRFAGSARWVRGAYPPPRPCLGMRRSRLNRLGSRAHLLLNARSPSPAVVMRAGARQDFDRRMPGVQAAGLRRELVVQWAQLPAPRDLRQGGRALAQQHRRPRPFLDRRDDLGQVLLPSGGGNLTFYGALAGALAADLHGADL
jgi:hypothetical protein